MSLPNRITKITVIGTDPDICKWFKQNVLDARLPWRVRFCEPLRIEAPENQIAEQDALIILWDQKPPVDEAKILQAGIPDSRSCESSLHALYDLGGEELCRRVIAFGRIITREDAIHLAEYGMRMILPLNDKRSRWDEEFAGMANKIKTFVEAEKRLSESEEEKSVQNFFTQLKSWKNISDRTKMDATDALLRSMGASVRYAEMMARKCIVELDYAGAEKWIVHALHKNPTYLKAQMLFVDLLMRTKRYDEALDQLEKLRNANPRSIRIRMLMGECYTLSNELQKADKAFLDALSIDEYNMVLRERLGRVKFLLKEFESARFLFKDISNPTDIARYLNQIGIKMVERNAFDEAIEHYRWARYVLPGNDKSQFLFFNIALAYVKWGRLKDSLVFARLAYARDPSYEKAKQLILRIEQKLAA